jgi:hypothetical protein
VLTFGVLGLAPDSCDPCAAGVSLFCAGALVRGAKRKTVAIDSERISAECDLLLVIIYPPSTPIAKDKKIKTNDLFNAFYWAKAMRICPFSD